MTLARINKEARLEKRKGRAKTAKKLARMVTLCLGALGLTAIWQERALSPIVHDRMQLAYAIGVDWVENSGSGSGYLTAMTGFQGNGNQSQYSPITEALLKLRQ